MSLLHEDLTEKIIGAVYKVYNTLGYGFLVLQRSSGRPVFRGFVRGESGDC